jgi:hypothetical protein
MPSPLDSTLDSWGTLLIATGGGLKLPQKYGYLLNFEWDANGSWKCTAMTEGYELTVPTVDGPKKIELCSADTSKEMLGVFTNPIGESSRHLQKIQENMTSGWVASLAAVSLRG